MRQYDVIISSMAALMWFVLFISARFNIGWRKGQDTSLFRKHATAYSLMMFIIFFSNLGRVTNWFGLSN